MLTNILFERRSSVVLVRSMSEHWQNERLNFVSFKRRKKERGRERECTNNHARDKSRVRISSTGKIVKEASRRDVLWN